jgi:predicted transposase/invertase (TIGR01784 family)
MHLILAQMPLFDKTPSQLETQQDKWFYFLKNLTSFESIPDILTEPIFQKAFETAYLVSMTPSEQAAYKESDKEWIDTVSALNTAHDKGEAKGKIEGKAEGEAETNRKNARAMKKKGLSAELIAEITGLALAEIEKL